jgi:hypothetical protein
MPASVDLSALRRVADLLADAPARADKVVQRARGTLQRRLLVEARRDIQTEYAIPAKRVADGLRARNISEGVELTGFKRGIGLINFNVSGGLRGRPVMATVFRNEARKEVFRAFIARAPNGALQVFERATARTRGQYGLKPEKAYTQVGRYAGTGIKREPLDAKYGPSVAQMLRKDGRSDRLAEYGRGLLASEIQRLFR